MNYYTINTHGQITAFGKWLFDPAALETDREIIYGKDGKLYFEGEEPQPPLEEARADALEKLRLQKWQAKNAGICVNGISIDTDDQGQATISGAVLNILRNPSFTARWKTSDTDENGASVWVDVGATEINMLADAMTAYTEACFAVEAVKQATLAALPDSQSIALWLKNELETGWPSRIINIGG